MASSSSKTRRWVAVGVPLHLRGGPFQRRTDLVDHSQVIIVSKPSAEPRDEFAWVDPHRRVAAGQRHATTFPGKRTHNRSAFTPKNTPNQRSTISRLRRASAPGWFQDWTRGVVGYQGAGIPPTRRDTRFGLTCPASRTTSVVLSACCNEQSITVTCGTPRCSGIDHDGGP